jgi:hypothetical protein
MRLPAKVFIVKIEVVQSLHLFWRLGSTLPIQQKAYAVANFEYEVSGKTVVKTGQSDPRQLIDAPRGAYCA